MLKLSSKRLEGQLRRLLDLGTIIERADAAVHPESLSVTDAQLDHHMVIEGMSGCGKTGLTQALTYQNILRGYPCCVIDPVGTLFESVVNFVSATNMRLALEEATPYAGWNAVRRRERHAWMSRFDVLDFADPDILGRRWNPMQRQDGLSTAEIVADLLRAIQRLVGDLTEMRRLQLVLRTVCTLVVELGGTTLRDVPDFLCLDSEDIYEYLRRLDERRREGKIAVPIRPDMVHQYCTSFFANTTSRERRELVQSAYNLLGMILSDAVAARFFSAPEGNVSFADIVNGSRWLLVHLPPGLDVHTQRILGSMIVNRIQLIAERRRIEDVRSGRVPRFSLICDEFHLLFDRHWADAISRVRNVGLNIVAAHQTDTQPGLDGPEGAGLLRAFRANASTHVYFRLWWEDAQHAAVPIFRPRGMLLKRQQRHFTETEATSRGEITGKTVSESTSAAHGRSNGTSKTRTNGENRSTGFSEANGVSRSETESSSVTEGTNDNRSESWADGVSVSKNDSETVTDGRGETHGSSKSHQTTSAAGHVSKSSGTGSNHGENHSRSVATAQGTGSSRSTTNTTSASRGTSESRGTSASLAKGLSQLKSQTESQGRTTSTAEAMQRSESETKTQSSGVARSESQQRGESFARGVTTTEEFYSIDEEIRVRAFELSELPRREAWVWMNEATETTAFKIRTHDIPQKFVTALGSHDYKAEFLRAVSRQPEPEPVESLLERALAKERPR
jgi:hypothetical protein